MIVGLDSNKLRSKAKQPMIDMEDKFAYGYDVTADEDTYEGWSGKMKEYTVQEGDTIESIADKFNTKPNEIALLNKKLGNLISDNVNTGQKIKIPDMAQEDTSFPAKTIKASSGTTINIIVKG